MDTPPDSWIILTNAPDNVYLLLNFLYDFDLPLEIAVGYDNFPKEGDLTLSDKMMSFLKNDILTPYKKLHKDKYKMSVTETFVLATETAYLTLGSEECWERPDQEVKYYIHRAGLDKPSEKSKPISFDFFQTKCREYLQRQTERINKELDAKMGSRGYYVDPVVLHNRKPIFDTNKDDILNKEDTRFVISSNSGQGKTIFLQNYFISNAQKFTDSNNRILPFYFHLSELRSYKEANLIEFLTNKVFGFAKKFNGIKRDNLIDLLDAKLDNGEILFLLDGFDQTQHDGNIPNLLGLVNGNDAFRKSRVVIASRPNAIDVLHGYDVLNIASFNSQQITAYFKKLDGIDNRKLKRLLQDFFEISETPILMFLLGKIAQGGELEEIFLRSDVYKLFYRIIRKDNLVKFKHKYQEEGSFPSSDEMMKQLQKISYIGLIKNEKLTISEQLLNKKIIRELPHIDKVRVKEMRIKGVSNVADYVKKVLCNFGIIYNILDEGSIDEKSLEFRHQSFQAYFAAHQLVEEINNKTAQLSDFLNERTDEAWLEVYRFYTELKEADDKDKLLITETMYKWYQAQKNKEMLYDAAKAFFCLKIKNHELLAKLKEELVNLVDIKIENVIENEKPFRALKDIGEIQYIAEYATKQKTFNTVNRFHAFKYAFSPVTGETLINISDVETLFKEHQKAGSTTKLDIYFGLNRIGSDAAIDKNIDFIQNIVKTVIPTTDKLIKAYSKIKHRSSRYLYEEWIKPIANKTKNVAFFVKGNPLYGNRERLDSIKLQLLKQYESIIFNHIYKNKDGKWIAYEDVCMFILARTGNETLVSRFYNDFLVLDKPNLTDEDLYKQAIAANALADCFPGEQSTNQSMVEKITDYCIDIFNNGSKNIYRYYIASALAKIGNQPVIDYFLQFIQNFDEKERWYGSMVLGCLDDQNMLNTLEKLSKEENELLSNEENENIRFFAGQALLIHSQTYI